MPLFLIPSNDSAPISVDKTILFFGRSPECDVVISDSRKVSRKHCCIALINNRLKVRDLGSTNGIKINGNPVTKDTFVNLGDTLTVGDITYTFTDQPKSSKTPQPSDSTAAPAAKPVVSPGMLVSQEFPVPIADAEHTVRDPRRSQPSSDEVIVLSDDDIVDDNA